MKHLAKRAFTYVLVLAMILCAVPLTAAAAENAATASAPEGDANVHVLESNTLEPFDKGAKADGDITAYDSYFTILWSKNSKVDSSKKSWEDGYASEQRINFGGAATTGKNAVMFTTSGPATVKIWWAKNGDSDRQMALLGASGDPVTTTEGTYESNKAYLSTLELAEAGTYYLGSTNGGNYIFKIEVEEVSAEKEYVLEAVTFGEVDKSDAPDEKAGTDSYFTINWGSKGKVDTTSAKFDDGYAPGYRFNFGGKSTKDTSRVIKFTTSGKATLKVWWVCGDAGRNIHIFDGSGEEIFVTAEGTEKNKAVITELELPDAGAYTVSATDGTCYILKVAVTEGASEKAPPAAWDTVAAPEITAVALDKEDANKVVVTVSALVGYDGADGVTVAMRDADGWELKTLNSLEETEEHTFEFTPSSSGTYVFEVSAYREGEADHRGENTATFDFTLPLTVPVIKYAVNDGKGGVTVEWNAVDEAEGYTVTVGQKTVDVTGTKAVIDGLTVGQTLGVSVVAFRGDSTGPAAKTEVTVSNKEEIAWVFAAFGQSISVSKNTHEVLDNGDVRVVAMGNAGKVQPAAQDGLSFYYTAIDPTTTNFVLTATAVVNEWTYTNGQEGFGLLVMDEIGVHGRTDPVYCNSFMVAASGLSGVGNNMRLGVGALARTGVTEHSSSAPATYKGTWLENMSGVGTDIRNLVGNCTNPDTVPGTTIDPALTTFQFKLEKNDEGYFVSYTDHNGQAHTVKYNDTLSNVDPYVYVGMFAARNVDVTYTDIQFTTSPASGAPTTGDGQEKTADVSFKLMNPTVSNQQNFELDMRSNADGSVLVSDAGGAQVFSGSIKAGEKLLVDVVLSKGSNDYTVTFTPAAGYVTADGAKLSSYDAVRTSASVTYEVDERTTIYVSPTGRADAKGTADDPTTLAEAVKCPAPGAVIILMDGTYELTGSVSIRRGINGTEDKPITLKAADNAASRPVLDWGETGSGLSLSADWWHLYGFDSTRSTGKGVHVGGKHNLVERVNTYENLNTGMSVTRTWSSDDIGDWPSFNTILNCSSWLNADSGYEDADGFEAKLTVGEGNVFDGCVAAYNADDGWDLYARGAYIGVVTLKNCVSFKNGYDIVDGKEVNAGNGNGFKLGGNNYEIDHRIINSVAFANKSSGFTCNSNPNLKVENCTSFGNGTGLSLYSTNATLDTAFEVHGFVSFGNAKADSIKSQGAQVKADYLNDTNYFQGNTSGEAVTEDWFKNLDTNTAISSGLTRNADGTVSLNGCLELTDKAPANAGARLPGAQGQNFRDVLPSAEYYKAVSDLVGKGYISGVTPGEYKPNKTLTRAEAAMILYRASGMKTPNLLLQYTDVKDGQWFADAVRFATASDIATGYGDGRFGPNDALTLEQLASMIYRYERSEKNGGFTGEWMFRLDVKDVADIDEWAYEAICWCVMNNVITAKDGVLAPRAVVNRAQAALIIDAYLNLE